MQIKPLLSQCLPKTLARYLSGVKVLVMLILFSSFLFSGTVSSQCPNGGALTIDGNSCDWANLSGYPISTHIRDRFGNGVDDQFTEGTKDFFTAAASTWKIGQTKPKNDIANAAVVLDGCLLYFAGDRTKVSGDAQIGFWFYLGGTAPRVLQVSPDSAGDFYPEHTIGDLLILSDFTGGGRNGAVTIYTWVGTGGAYGNGTLDKATNVTGIVAINNDFPADIPAGWDYPSAQYPVNAFYEGKVDLCALEDAEGNPIDFCFSSFLLEARSSQELTASLDDFVAGAFNVVPSVSINNQTVCSGQSATFTATVTGGIAPITYSFNGGSFTASNTFTINPATTSGSVTVVAKGGGQTACESEQATGTLTVNQTPGAPTAGPNSRCGPGTVSLTASGCTGTLKWYAAASGGTSIATGSPFVTSSIATTTSYWVSCTIGACEGPRTEVIATVNGIPGAPTAGPNSRCGTGTVSLTATGCTGTLNWYAAASGGASIGTGSPFVTTSISSTTSYWVSCTSAAGCEGPRTEVVATVNAVPGAPTAGPNSRCGTGTVSLTASGCTGTLNWYAAASGGASIATGSPFVTGSISTTTSYWVSCTSAAGCEGPRTEVVATVNGVPGAPTAGPNSRCGTGTVSLTASGCTGTLNWYAAASGGASIATGSPFVTGSIASTTSYWVSCTSAAGCEGPRTEVVATVNTIPGAPTAGPNSRCGTGTVSLTASGCTGTLNWYAAASGGASIGTGSPFVTGSIASTTSYWVSCTSAAGCEGPRTEVVATVNVVPGAPIAGPNSRCGEGTVSLTASGCTGTLKWYAAASGGSSIATGSPFVTGSIATTTSYWVSCTSAAGCEGPRTEVIATINPGPSAPIAGPNSRCGTGTVSLTATGCTGTLNWYAAASGGASIATGSPFVTGSIASTTSYWVSCTSAAGCESGRTEVVATVNAVPGAPTAGPNSRCGTGTVSLTATGCTGTLKWYAAASGGSSIATGSPFVTGSISTTTSYWVSCTSAAGCEGPRTEVVATVNTVPGAPTAGPNSRCGTGTVSLTASGCTGTLNWYAAASGGASIATGSPFVTGSIASTTSYWVSCTSAAGCEGPRTEVVATVNAIPGAPTAGPNSRCGTGTVSLTASGCTGTLNWYAAASGGASIGTGSPFVTGSIASTTSYWVSCTSAAGCEGPRTEVVATVNAIPGAPTAGPNNRCGPGTVSLTASGCTGTLKWYAAASGGASIATGSPFVTGSIATTTSYWVSCTSAAGCEGPRTEVVATIKPIPTTTAGNTSPICVGGTFSVTASNSLPGATFGWTGPNMFISAVQNPPAFTNATLAMAGTYTVTVTLNGCASTSTTTVGIVENPIIYVPVASPYCAGDPAKGTVTLPNSQTGVNYTLLNDAALAVPGQPVKAGSNGVALVWTGLDAGGYLVQATGSGPTNCANLTNPAIVVENQLPNPVADDKEVCLGDCVTLSSTPAGGVWNGAGVTGSQFCTTGLGAGTYTVTYTVTNITTGCQSSDAAVITVKNCSAQICTYTQGYYGNAGGKSCDGTVGGLTTAGLIAQSLGNWNGTLTVGKTGHSIAIMNNVDDIACVIAKMPGGGASKELLAADYGICSLPASYLKNGRINNTLLSQTIALGLNVGITKPSTLGSFGLQAGVLATAKPVGGCGSNVPMTRTCVYNTEAPYQLLSVTNEYSYRTISAAIYNAITPKTVAGLLELANNALANTDNVAGSENGVSLSEIAGAAGAINEVFDECRIFIGWNVVACAPFQSSFAANRTSATVSDDFSSGSAVKNTAESITKLNVTAYPNPFTDKVRFEIKSAVSGKGTLEVYNMTGQKLSTVYAGQVFAGKGQVIEFKVSPAFRTNMIYILKVGGQQVVGKLININ